MSVPVLVDTKYKEKSYRMFLILFITVAFSFFFGFFIFDHHTKSDEPLSSFFVKSKANYITENIRLTRQLDSVKSVAAQVPMLKKALDGSNAAVITSNVQVPKLGHYQDQKNLKQNNYQAYLIEKLRFYYNKSEVQSKFINDNF